MANRDEIGTSAFCSCGALKEAYLADGVKALYDGCFDYVTTLKKLYIPSSVEIAQCLSSQNDGSHLVSGLSLRRCFPPGRLVGHLESCLL